MTKGLKGALFAPLVAGLLVLGAPAASQAAPSHQGDPPAAGQGQDPPRGAHSAHPDDPKQKDGQSAKPDPDGNKDPKAGNDQPKDPNAGNDRPGADKPGADKPGADKPG